MSPRPTWRFVLPLGLIALFTLLAWGLWALKPEPQRRFTPPQTQLTVEVETLQARDYPVAVGSYGLVQPRVRSELIAQVGGKIDYVAESFRDGGFFQKDELLVAVEKADYEIAVTSAEANLLDAQMQLEEQLALAEQARQDWARMERSGEPAALVLKKPQVAAARARVKSAEAELAGARLNLRRTEIRAPYAGRVLQKSVDYGQVISANASLGEIYGIDAVEVRLPIRHSEIPLLELPERYRVQSQTSQNSNDLPAVTLYSEMLEPEAWQGRLVRTAGAIDDTSRQLYVVARIDDPYGDKALGRTPLKIGQYVSAEISGKTLQQVIVIDNASIYQGSFVYLFVDGTLQRRPISIRWQNAQQAVIAEGLQAGEQLVTTALGQVASGTRARLKDSERPSAKAERRAP